MKVKDRAEDFLVEEVLHLDIKKRGQYAYFLLEKKCWNTIKAVNEISKILKISAKRFAFAGQKDRLGITKQYVSAFQVSERDLERIRLKDITIKFVGYGDKPINLGDLEGNKFKLRIKELKRPLRQINCIVNYYDDQRFGGYRPNMHLAGKEALLGNYEKAIRILLLYPFPGETPDYKEARKYMEDSWGNWDIRLLPNSLVLEKNIIGYLMNNKNDYKGALKSLPRQLFMMLTHAYQSYIFNESLARYLRKHNKNYREVKYTVGTFVFVDDYFKKDWPIVGYESNLDGEMKEIIEKIMKEENIWYDTFKCEIPALASKGLKRRAMVKVKEFKLGKFDKTKGEQEVKFFLSKGSYATIVMKSLE